MAHYAISEFLIVAMGGWVAVRFFQQARFAAMLAVVLFSAAAMIGVIRYGLDMDGNLIVDLAPLHRFLSLIGGTAAMMLLVYDLLTRRADIMDGLGLYSAVSAAALLVAVIFNGIAVLLFLLWSVGFIYLATYPDQRSHIPPLQKMLLASLMLIAVILFRQASWLSPAVSWHVFHICVAVWLYGLSIIFLDRRRALA